MSQSNEKKQKKPSKFKSLNIQWRIFFSLFAVAILILLVLWTCQVLFINSFYQYAKTNDLKKATDDVISNLDAADNTAIIERIILQGDINIRIIRISDFKDIYSGGDGLVSATHDIGDYEILDLYDEAVQNGGEVSRYYTYDKESQYFMGFDKADASDGRFSDLQGTNGQFQAAENNNQGNQHQIGVQFFSTKPLFLIRNDRYVDDFLYAKVVENARGEEIMVISDIQVTPLDSTVSILKLQLEVTTLLAFAISFLVSYLVSKKISNPIIALNGAALKLARGEFDTEFSASGYSEIEQLSDTLNYTAKELGKAEQYRKELIANVSHDLRTPLTMIGGYAEVMRDIPGENSPENVQVIIDETKRLTAFVNDLLDLSKLESGMNALEIKPMNLTEVLRNMRKRYFDLTKNDGYHIEIDADKDVYISGDEGKLSQAFYNLMDNAVNHTGKDKTVTIRQILLGKDVRIEIADSGEGIPEDELTHIWDRYYRTGESHKRSVVGSGIGLSIVKSVVELHGLRYGVESQKEHGTVFWVELRLEK